MHYELNLVHGVKDIFMHDMNFNTHVFTSGGEGVNEIFKGYGTA